MGRHVLRLLELCPLALLRVHVVFTPEQAQWLRAQCPPDGVRLRNSGIPEVVRRCVIAAMNQETANGR
jgi:hypothetical protein